MNTFKIALANLQFPPTPDDSVRLAAKATQDAAAQGAEIVCFPECYVPGYRAPGKGVPPPDARFLDDAWMTLASAAARARITVVLGTERVVDGALRATRRLRPAEI